MSGLAPSAGTDLLGLARDLVGIRSVSHDEAALADLIESGLRALPWLEVTRVADNVVARTTLGRGRRVVLGGHLDTVPPSGNERARLDGEVLWGLGAADMKGGVAVLWELARQIPEPEVDVTYVLYACEEVDRAQSGLRQVNAERPELLVGDVAVLAEPTGGSMEAGCQGTMRVAVTLRGRRAHTARAWAGSNAVHRLTGVLAAVAGYEPRVAVVEGCRYLESLQAVKVEGGVAGNVVPDTARLLVNHRFAPDTDSREAEARLRELLEPLLSPGDTVEVEDLAPGARPHLEDPFLAALAKRTGRPVRAKLGWTDVAFFAERGVPAANFGPGDPEVAHSADERVTRSELEGAYSVLAALLVGGAGGPEGPIADGAGR